MKALPSSVLFFLLLCSAFPAFAEDGPRIFTGERSYDPCARQTGRELLRCESRQQEIRDNADAARALRSLDSSSSRAGLIRLRRAEREHRAAQNALDVASRPTLQTVSEGSDINTSRVDYLQQYRQDTLRCMFQTTARTRAICLDEARNSVREEMKAQRGTLRYYQSQPE
ncbi:MAG: hypothetical protein PHO92_01680 [Candidatus Peribacteraceae bacterium]|nr:hypothetical protein [Candidatus Peribacteraceae bacterium]